MEDREAIRRASFVEHQSIRAIARELQHGRHVIRAALASAEAATYRLSTPWAAPRLGTFKAVIDGLLAENANAPRKQRYMAHKIFQQLKNQGYLGSEATVRRYVAHQRQSEHKRPVFLPLEFGPGRDAQVDWGEAQDILGGVQQTIQYFELRLNYSRKVFTRAYPVQKQDAFFDAHVAAFHYLGGVPHTLIYDNLTPAVRQVLEGHRCEEQRAFIAFRYEALLEES